MKQAEFDEQLAAEPRPVYTLTLMSDGSVTELVSDIEGIEELPRSTVMGWIAELDVIKGQLRVSILAERARRMENLMKVPAQGGQPS